MRWPLYKTPPVVSRVHEKCPLVYARDDAGQYGQTTVTRDGNFVRVVEIQGRDYTGLDEATDERLFEERKRVFEAFGPRLVPTLFSLRHRLGRQLARAHHGNRISDAIAHRWAEHFGTAYRTRHFIVLRTASGALVDQMVSGAQRGFARETDAERLRLLDDAVQMLEYGLKEYRARPLNGDDLATFWAWLLNGRYVKQRMPADGIFDDLLTATDLHWPDRKPYQVYRRGGEETYSAWLTIKAHPDSTATKMLAALFHVQREFSLVQTYRLLPKESALRFADDKFRWNMAWKKDSDIAITELTEVKQRIEADEIHIAKHGFAVQVFAGSLQGLEAAVKDIETAIESWGIRVRRETVAQEPLWWSQFPSYEHLQVRMREVTTDNLADFVTFSSIGEGFDSCSWGDQPVCLFKTEAGTEYSFTFHSSPAPRALGHILTIGGSNSGKTTLMSMLTTHVRRFPRVRSYMFDRLHGMEVAVRMQGGTYTDFLDTPDLAPLQLPDTPANRAFLATWFEDLVGRTDDEAKARIAQAIDMIYRIPRQERTLAAVADAFGQPAPGSVRKGLEKWLPDGAFGSFFTGKRDALDFSNTLIGMDMTAVLDMPEVLGPLTRYIFHRIETTQQAEGAPFFIHIDEFRNYLQAPSFRPFFDKATQEYRKLDGVIAASMQTAKHIWDFDKGRALIDLENIASFFLFPDPSADPEPYLEGFGLTKEEFDWIKKPHYRQVMLKRRGGPSTILNIDMTSLGELLRVYDGSSEAVRRLNRLRRRYSDWTDRYLQGDEE